MTIDGETTTISPRKGQLVSTDAYILHSLIAVYTVGG